MITTWIVEVHIPNNKLKTENMCTIVEQLFKELYIYWMNIEKWNGNTVATSKHTRLSFMLETKLGFETFITLVFLRVWNMIQFIVCHCAVCVSTRAGLGLCWEHENLVCLVKCKGVQD